VLRRYGAWDYFAVGGMAGKNVDESTRHWEKLNFMAQGKVPVLYSSARSRLSFPACTLLVQHRGRVFRGSCCRDVAMKGNPRRQMRGACVRRRLKWRGPVACAFLWRSGSATLLLRTRRRRQARLLDNHIIRVTDKAAEQQPSAVALS